MISLIACVGKNYEIGKDGGLCWKLPQDLEFFKQKTMGHTVVMGYNTFKSLGFKPLKKRHNIVITNEPLDNPNFDQVVARTYEKDGVVRNSYQDFIKMIIKSQGEVFIIGGAQIYGDFLPYADRIYLTEVDRECEGADKFFPQFDKTEFAHTLLGQPTSEITYNLYERKHD